MKTPTMATIDVQDDEEVVTVIEDDEVTLTEDEFGKFSKIAPLKEN